MRLLMMLVGFIDKEDWYNSGDIPILQIIWVRLTGTKRGEVWTDKAWWKPWI